MIYAHSRGEFLFSSSENENENYANKFSLILFSYTYEMRGSSTCKTTFIIHVSRANRIK